MPSLWPIPVAALEPVACGSVVWRLGGVLRATVIVKATFAIVHDGVASLIEPLAIVRSDHAGGDAARGGAPDEAAETAPYLPSAGVILRGHAHAPAGRWVTASAVRLAIYRDRRALLDKTLHVFGDRWVQGGAAGAPQPFARMPIVYERAFGGPGVDDNPVGTGASGVTRQLPNVVDPASPARPAGFGPIASHWPARARLLGNVDRARAEALWTELPDTFDFRYYQPAPRDQQIEYLAGDEWIVLDGLSPTLPRVQTRLPSARGQARAYQLFPGGASPGRPIDLVADLLVIDADRLKASVVWRGHFVVDAPDALPRLRIFAGVEMPGIAIGWPDPEDLVLGRGAEGGAGRTTEPMAEPAREAPRAAPLPRGPGPGGSIGGIEDEGTSLVSLEEMGREGPATVRVREHPAPPSAPAAQPAPSATGGERTKTLSVEEILAHARLPVAPFKVSGPGSTKAAPVPAIPGAPWARDAAAPPRDARIEGAAARPEEPPPLEPSDADEGGTLLIAPEEAASAGPSEGRSTLPGMGPAMAMPFGLPGLPFGRQPVLGAAASAPISPAPPSARGAPVEATPRPSPLVSSASPGSVTPPPPVAMAPVATDTGPAPPAFVERPSEPVPPLVAPAPSPEPEPPARVPTPLGGSELDRPATDASARPALVLGGAGITDESTSGRRGLGALALAPSVADEPSHARALRLGVPAAEPTGARDAAAPPREALGRLGGAAGGLILAPVTAVAASATDTSAPSAAPERGAESEPEPGGVRAKVLAKLRAGEAFYTMDLAGADLSGIDFSGCALGGCNLRGANLARCTFTDARLSDAKLAGADLTDAVLTGADLARADLARATLSRARLDRATLAEADLSGAQGLGATFAGARADRATFARGVWDGASFEGVSGVAIDYSGASLSGARFDNAKTPEVRLEGARGERPRFDGADLRTARAHAASLPGASFQRCDARGSTWEKAELAGARFDGANLAGAVLVRAGCGKASFASADLSSANLQHASGDGADFRGATLESADLRQARLPDARFDEAILRKVVASRADLARASLRRADLTNVSLRSAKLKQAVLAGACLAGADLRDADLEQADLRGADRKGAKLNGANLKGSLDDDAPPA